MTYLTAALAVVCFLVACRQVRFAPAASRTLWLVRKAGETLRQQEQPDEEKERVLRQLAPQLFRAAFSILVRGSVALLASLLPVFCFHTIGWASLGESVAVLSSWEFILGSTVLMLVGQYVSTGTPHTGNTSGKSRYSSLDRAVHQLAFQSMAFQRTAADLEHLLLRRRYEHLQVARPLFITSLPRAGTTVLLQALHLMPDCATTLYRDMPFICAPLAWHTWSRHFRRPPAPLERAHGDGVTIDYDSPEAFEEVIWKLFWRDKYQPDRIVCWRQHESRDGFREFFLAFIQKILALRRGARSHASRYLSKNNANISRIAYLKNLFPDCTILIPVRHPIDHAVSLQRQHANFLRRHAEDPFSRRYMEDIGHYEFGKLHRPIDFPGLHEIGTRFTADRLDYWVGYWITAFEVITAHARQVTLISYEDLCRDGQAGLEAICHRLGLSPGPALGAAGSLFRPARGHEDQCAIIDKDLLHCAEDLHARLLGLSMPLN